MLKKYERAINDYNQACNRLLEIFAEKHELSMDDSGWVAEEPGGVACIGDHFVDMPTIIADIVTDAPEEEFWRWYEYSAEVGLLGLPDECNFKSWLKGCPRYSNESLSRIRGLQQSLQESAQILKDAIRQEFDRLCRPNHNTNPVKS